MFKLDGLSIENEPAITKWRYEDLGDDPVKHRWRAWWAGGDAVNDVSGIELRAYPVVRATPCGVWIDDLAWRDGRGWQMTTTKGKWLSIGGRQSWAKLTQDAAIESLAIRLCRWTNMISDAQKRAGDAATSLKKLRPDLACFSETAIKNLKRDWR